MTIISEIIKDSKLFDNIELEEELSDILMEKINNKQLERFYLHKLNFLKDEITELIEVMNYLDNKYLNEVLYLAKYYEYNIFIEDIYLQKNYNEIINEEIEMINYFIFNNYNHIIKYLISTEIIDIHDKEYYTFKIACEYGNLEIVQYFISLEKTHGKIDIHDDGDYAFLVACENNKIDIAQFLLSLENTHGKIDIHIDDENIFRRTCI